MILIPIFQRLYWLEFYLFPLQSQQISGKNKQRVNHAAFVEISFYANCGRLLLSFEIAHSKSSVPDGSTVLAFNFEANALSTRRLFN